MKTTSPQIKSAYLNTRVSLPLKEEFVTKASVFGPHTEILRELVEAFVEDRLSVKPPNAVNNPKEKLYVTGK